MNNTGDRKGKTLSPEPSQSEPASDISIPSQAELAAGDSPQQAEVPPDGTEVASLAGAEAEETDLRDKIIEEYKKEKEELYDRLLRKQAEFENFRKRIEKEKKEGAAVVRAAVIREFLPVLDACERALKSLSEADTASPAADPFRAGAELIYKQFLDTLAKFQVFAIPAVGHAFDPNLHHAIVREESAEYTENQILEELLKGYTFENRLLRPAQVKVAVPPASRAPKPQG